MVWNKSWCVLWLRQGPNTASYFCNPIKVLASDDLHRLAALGGRPQGIDRESGVLDRISVAHNLHSEVFRCRRYGNPLSGVAIDVVASDGVGDTDPDATSAGPSWDACWLNKRAGLILLSASAA